MLRKRPAKPKPPKPDRRRGFVLNLSGGDTAGAEHDGPAPETPPAPLDPLFAHETLGEALRAIRHDKGLTLEELAETTRVRRAYLEAIEEMRLDALPSRPFTIGYIRAYATALGLDPDAATERFKADEPVLDEPLRAPVGVLDDKDPRVAAFVVGAIAIIAAIILWNVAQRSMLAAAPPPPLASQAAAEKALAQLKSGPVELGYPLPAPVESTTPPPYETPGLAEAMGLKPEEGAARPKPANEAPAVNLATLPPVFQAEGKVYDTGNPRLASTVTLKALKPALLILRGADGSIYFARQMAKGEAFRVPELAGATLDVSSANDFQVFAYGQSKGVLPAAQMLASKLGAPPPSVAAPPTAPIKPVAVGPAPAAPPAAKPAPAAAKPAVATKPAPKGP